MLTKRSTDQIKRAALALSREMQERLRAESLAGRTNVEAHYANVREALIRDLVRLYASARNLDLEPHRPIDENLDAASSLSTNLACNVESEPVETIGEVYEYLLSLSPQLSPDGSVKLSRKTTKERKLSGSYYTPSNLISTLLDQSLEPLLTSAREPLSLRIIDPSVGTGMFLIAAARRISAHAGVPIGDVVRSCLFGVDTNPAAVEICIASLCLEAGDLGLAEVLRTRILVGNLLLGASRDDVVNGVPDEAYQPLEGDDPHVCRDLRDRNSELRERLPMRSNGLCQAAFDAWCAAFVQRKSGRSILSDALGKPRPSRTTTKLAESYRFLHPELAFAEVMVGERSRGQGIPRLRLADFDSNEHQVLSSCRRDAGAPSYVRYKQDDSARETSEAGFDLVIGNPPYVPLYSRKSARDDKKLARSANLASYINRNIEGEPALSGRTNTFLLFLSLGARLAKNGGAVAFVLPDSFATNESYEKTRRALIERGWLRSFTTYTKASFGETAVRTSLLVWSRGNGGNTVLAESSHPGEEQESRSFAKEQLLNRPGMSLRLKSAYLPPEGWIRLGDIAEIRDGINPGPQKVRKRIVAESAKELPGPWKKTIVGNDISPMELTQPMHWVRYDPSSVSPADKKAGTSLREQRIFETERIVYRQTAKRPIACICPAGVYTLNSVHNVLLFEPDAEILRAVCSYLNTDFCARIYADMTGETRNLFPQVHASSMRMLPMPPELMDRASKLHQCAIDPVNGIKQLNDLLEYLSKNTDSEEPLT